MSTNNIFGSFVKILFAVSLLQMSTIAVKANDLNFGGFEGTLSTIISSGVAIRTEDNSCRLISGDSLNPDGAGANDRSATVGFVGMCPPYYICVTDEPLVWLAALVDAAPLVQPVRFVPSTPV